ncbi:MAG: tetratricopeptide repeat protein [Oscillospiraceae bacterium]|nr:tetratricopeptide repeat protein [Oscillospiraceae bacterium]
MIMTIELLLIIIAVCLLFITNAIILCINISDKQKEIRNQVDRLSDNTRLNVDLKSKNRFKKTLRTLLKHKYVKNRTFKKAAMTFMKIAQKTGDPLDKSYCLGWAGRCYDDYGDRVLAAVCYSAAVEISPSDIFASNQLGDFYRDSESRESETHYNRALEYDPLSSATYFKLAKFHSRHGESETAIEKYQTAIKANNGYVAPMAEAAIESAKIGDIAGLMRFYFLAMANDVYEFEKLEEAIKECI